MFSNCVAVPFDEDDKDDSVWFLDHDYLENMYGMFKKVNGEIASLYASGTIVIFYTLVCFIESVIVPASKSNV